jgi:hypothetical protein
MKKTFKPTVLIQGNNFQYEKKRISKENKAMDVIALYKLFHYATDKNDDKKLIKLPQAGLLIKYANGKYAVQHPTPIFAQYKFGEKDVKFLKMNL